MLRWLALITIALTCADHWTTYVCLSSPIDGWQVTEANPVARWLFERAGLAGGLLIDSLVTFAAVAFLASTRTLGDGLKLAIFGVITLSTGYAVLNNLGAITRMGLAPWSGVV